ncbi:MAG: hypothetical protein D6677_09090 [Calditrichaeota bacterium]|nr:MAG: hypothetical protein D6677_09090 [Calditrichota bacterium]
MRLIFLLLGINAFYSLAAQDVETGGYVKSLSGYMRHLPYGVTGSGYQEIQGRLNFTGYWLENNSFTVETRLRAMHSSLLEKWPGYKESLITTYPYLDLGRALYQSDKAYVYLQPDRLFWNYDAENWQLTLGRQRVAWGTSLVWNITDLFNPQSVLAFDYEERPGSDVLRFQYFTGVTSSVEVVWQPAPKKDQRILAVKMLWSAGAYDVHVLAAWQRSLPVLGAAFSGSLLDGGLRGEFKWTPPPEKDKRVFWNVLPEEPLSDGKHNDWQWVLSYDYMFPNNMYLHAEALYNHLGVRANSLFYADRARDIGMLNASRCSLFAEWSWQWHPLSRVALLTIKDPDDGSAVWMATFNWSMAANWDLDTIALIGRGPDTGRYRSLGESLYLRIKYTF